jgi:hypothetical protein
MSAIPTKKSPDASHQGFVVTGAALTYLIIVIANCDMKLLTAGV